MKKKIYFIFGLLVFGYSNKSNAQAPQIVNSGFENWSTPKKAVGWTSTNDVLSNLSLQNVYKDSVTKIGNYSIRLKCVSLFGNAIPGIITNGSYPTNSFNTQFNPNLIRPVVWIYSERPDSLTGYYKYTKQGTDTGTIGIRFFKNNAIIGEGVFWALSSTSTLQRFSAYINWTNSQIPDSMYIIASTGGISSNTDGSELILDNLGFAGLTGIKSISKNDGLFAYYPNPAQNFIKISTNSFKLKSDDVFIYNLLGELVLKTKLNSNNQINIELLKKGVYITELISDNEDKIVFRFIKE